MEDPTDVPIVLYDDFPEDWDHFSDEVKRELGEFLQRLQKGPSEPELLKVVKQHDSYFAYQLAAGGALYWKLEYTSGFLSPFSTKVKRILILAVEFDI